VRHSRRLEPPALDGLVTHTLGNMLEKRSAWRRCSGPRRGARSDRATLLRVSDTHQSVRRWRLSRAELEAAVAHIDRLKIEIIRRSGLSGLSFCRGAGVVERALAWLNRCRRLAKDWDVSNASFDAWMVVSSRRRMTRPIAKLRVGLLACRWWSENRETGVVGELRASSLAMFYQR
jgi:hypothetical protein